jgi:glycosyltransferase involved in cell wall biosynthesis
MTERELYTDKSLKVLYFSTFVSRESGASYALRQMVRRAAQNDISPIIVVPASLESVEMFPASEFDVIYSEMKRPRRTLNVGIHARYCLSFPKTLAALRQLIRDRHVQVVHCNEITDFMAAFAAKLEGVPCIYQVRHDGIPNPYRRVLTFVLEKTADAIVVPSKSTAAWLIASSKALAERISLIYDYAFDADEYEPGTSGAGIRKELGIGSDDILVVLVSKLVTPKGHLCFVRAAEMVRASSARIRFVIVGGPVPGHDAEASAIQSLARKIAPELILTGPRNDLPSIYAACDIAVHCPIYPDTYPTVVLLPMLMGKPVVATNIGGIPEQIEDGKSGVLVSPDDPRALAQALLSLASDSQARATLGQGGMKKVRSDYATQRQGLLIASLYQKVSGYSRDKRNKSARPSDIRVDAV